MKWRKNQDPHRERRSSKRWQELRLAVLRDQYGMCVLCGRLATEVHHKEMATEENFFVRENLAGLCPACHKRIHAAYRKGFSWGDVCRE
ncbi:MAG: HNH endonuclease [Lentisphaeria bacterium]|nr:HNH endonuclease [Lentisphaeria bacterium]